LIIILEVRLIAILYYGEAFTSTRVVSGARHLAGPPLALRSCIACETRRGIIGVPKGVKDRESRVGIMPAGIESLAEKATEVVRSAKKAR
jgi:hypothetical protein